MVVALGAWWTSASALPTTTVAFTTAPTGTHVVGDELRYVGTATLTGGPSVGATTFTVMIPRGVGNVLLISNSVGLTGPALPIGGSCTGAIPVVFTATDLPAGTYTF